MLDVLRGFALFGILVMNMHVFAMPWGAWALQPRPFQGGLDRAVEFMQTALFAGKANAIFSFLFGLGMTIQLRRGAERGGAFVPMYLRRLAALFVIGAVHAVLLWSGDVLHIYAGLGLLLLAVRDLPDRGIFALVGLFLLAPLVRDGWSLVTQEPPIHPVSYYEAQAHAHIAVFRDGTYAQQVAARLGVLYEGYVEAAPRLQGWLWVWVSFAVTMLLGLWTGRRRLLEDVQAHAPVIRRIMIGCLGLGVALAIAFAVLLAVMPPPSGQPTLLGFLTGVTFHLHRPLLCIGYVAAIALLFERTRMRRLLLPLASAGAMPLSNYLLQTVIATTIFYSHGLGLFAALGAAPGFVIAVTIFAVQLVLSRLWLSRFRYGPLEWLWRGATYGRLPAIRRS